MNAHDRQVIRSLAPRVTQTQAIDAFGKGLWRAIRGDRLRSVAAAWLPFRLYEVQVVNGGRLYGDRKSVV